MDFTTKPLPTAPAKKVKNYSQEPIPSVPVELNVSLEIWEWIAHQAVSNNIPIEKWLERHFKSQMLAFPIPRTSSPPKK